MNRKQTLVAAIVGVLLLALVVIVFLTSRAESPAHANGSRAEREAIPASVRDVELTGHTPGERVPGERSADPVLAHDPQRADAGSDPGGPIVQLDDPLAELLARLRAAADEDGFHDTAWPIVLAISGLLQKDDPECERSVVRVRDVALDEAEHGHVRSACVVALAQVNGEVALAVADELVQAVPVEAQRGAWLARGMAADGPPGLAIALRRYERRLPSFPVDFRRTTNAVGMLQAFERAERVMPAGTDGFTDDVIAARREESFTRQLAVLAVLGPAVQWPGEVRDRMLRWLQEKTREAGAVRPAALHCLALAARDDDALARQLVAIARAQLFELGGTDILAALAQLAGRDDLVLSALQEFFQNPDAMHGPKRTLAHTNALVALEGVLASQDARVREQAIALAMEQILDPNADEFERTVFMAMLSGTEAGNGALFDILSLAALTGDPNALTEELSLIGSVPAEQHAAAHAWLVQLLDDPDASVDLRRSVYTQIRAIAAPGALDFLRGRLATETDADLRALLERYVAELGG